MQLELQLKVYQTPENVNKLLTLVSKCPLNVVCSTYPHECVWLSFWVQYKAEKSRVRRLRAKYYKAKPATHNLNNSINTTCTLLPSYSHSLVYLGLEPSTALTQSSCKQGFSCFLGATAFMYSISSILSCNAQQSIIRIPQKKPEGMMITQIFQFWDNLKKLTTWFFMGNKRLLDQNEDTTINKNRKKPQSIT